MSLCTDRSNSTNGDQEDLSQALSTLSQILFFLSFLLGVPGNGAVVWVTGFKMKRTAHTVCFLNLAVADLTYCLTLPLQLVRRLVEYRRHAVFFQNFIIFSVHLNMSASIFLLTLISISRCLAVTRPIWFRQRLRLAWVSAACFGAWGLAFLTCLPIFLARLINAHHENKACVSLQVSRAVFTFGLPVVIMASCYFLIGRELRGKQFAQSRKPVVLIVTVVAAFITCWLPITVCRLLQAFRHVSSLWMFFTFHLASFNSALNPLLYVFVGRDVRQVFRRSPAATLRLAFADEEVRVGERPCDSAVNTETSV